MPPTIDDFRRSILKSDVESSGAATNELARWILASLLLMNGGAIVALLGNDTTKSGLIGSAGWFFISGLGCSLFGGFTFLFFYDSALTDTLDRLWSEEPLPAERRSAVKATPFTRYSLIAGLLLWILSFGMFVAGCVSASHDLRRTTDAARKAEARHERVERAPSEEVSRNRSDSAPLNVKR